MYVYTWVVKGAVPLQGGELQIVFHKRATKYRALLLKMTYKDKGSYESSPPCNIGSCFCGYIYICVFCGYVYICVNSVASAVTYTYVSSAVTYTCLNLVASAVTYIYVSSAVTYTCANTYVHVSK